MTVVLLLNPKINYMTIPLVVPVKNVRTIPPCGNFSNHISRTFLNHSSHWFKLNDVMQVLGLLHCMTYITKTADDMYTITIPHPLW
jgi:hypothetical protein